MIAPKKPNDEEERLDALYALNVLDTAAEERFDRITRIASKLFDVPIVLVSLIDSNRQWCKSLLGVDIQEISRDISFCGHTILNDGMMIVEDATKDKRFNDNPLVTGNPNIRFYLGCPLKISDHNIGALCLIDEKTRQFTPEDMDVMRDLTNMIQVELESIRLSTTDELTQLLNRRGFLQIANYFVSMSKREDRKLALLFFDLDKFKQINDTHGHAEGDKVLKTFSKALVRQFRGSDVIARLGGDEFCILCSDLDEEKVKDVLKRFSKAFIEDKSAPHAIQYSCGYVQYDKNKHHDFSELLEEADQKMYDNKRNKS